MPTPCKICGAETALQGPVDFNRTCEVSRGVFAPLSGIAIWYRRCDACGFVFTTDFDGWTRQEFRDRIYNDGYAAADPDQPNRQRHNARNVLDLRAREPFAKMLDYGGGDGEMAVILRENGVDARSWDIMNDGDEVPIMGEYDLVTAFEVLEHTPTPRETAGHAVSLLKTGGLLFLSTLTVDIPPQSCDHWYMAPRNGHVSIQSKRSLAIMFAHIGCELEQMTDAYFLARKMI